MYKNLIFDLDNTLCECSELYTRRFHQFAEFQSERTGLEKDFVYKLREKLDIEFTKLPDGFNRTRFPRSMAATSVVLDIMVGNNIDENASEESFLLGDSVFSETYPLYEGIMNMLMDYKNSGMNLFLFSKGDYDVQMRKVILNNLTDIFSTDKTYIVGQKNPADLEKILTDHDLQKSETLVIGDSLKDEIGCAASLSVDSVWIFGDSLKYTWGYENESHPYTHKIEKTIELPVIIPIAQTI